MSNDSVNASKLWMPTDSMYSTETANYSPVYTMSQGSFGDFWDCVLNNSAQCGLFRGGNCTAASAIIVTVMYFLAAKAAAAGLASQLGKKLVGKTIDKLKTIIEKWGTTTVTIGGVTYNIPWEALASLLDGPYASKIIDLILLNDYAKAKRICKCLIC